MKEESEFEEQEEQRLLTHIEKDQPLDIRLVEWEHTCGDGCCHDWGTNGIELEGCTERTDHILEKILFHLGYNVKVETIYENE